jgi:hypothetical protein
VLDTAEAFLKKARSSTALDDFGDEGFMAGLRVLASDLDHSGLPDTWAQQLRGIIESNLENRLRLLAVRGANPGVAEEAIERPLFVIGLPRTGTSALVDMLAQDPAARVLLQWEMLHLSEVLDRDTWATDPRIAEVEAVFQNAPRAHAAMGLHTYGATLPDECNVPMTMNLQGPNMSVLGHLPRYNEWTRLSRMQQPYALHKYVLQHLQHFGRGGRWTLKSPFHVFDIPGLLESYPDAVFVQTHRDPLQLIPSLCGLYSTIRGEGPGDPGRAVTGREIVDLWGTGLQRLMAARMDPAVDRRILDLSHRQMISDPLGTVRTVYERFDLPFDADVEERMQKWIAAPAQHMSPVKFKLDEFGLTPNLVEAAFGPYRERFADLF